MVIARLSTATKEPRVPDHRTTNTFAPTEYGDADIRTPPNSGHSEPRLPCPLSTATEEPCVLGAGSADRGEFAN